MSVISGAGIASLWVAAPTAGQTLPGSPSEAAPQEQVPVELFQAPHPKKIAAPNCGSSGERASFSRACEELVGGTEGWVEVGLMVDVSGKPFEVTVIRSTGNKTFEKEAVEAIERSSFEPASLNGKPVEAGYEIKYKFVNASAPQGAGREFASAYRKLTSAIDSGDRAAADAAMSRLKITSLYEDAYYGLASYQYARKWGSESQQLEGVRRAIAGEDQPRYLPRDVFRSILLTCLKLEVQTHEYAEALATWKRLEKVGVDASTAALVRPIVEKLERLRSDDNAYEVDGVMPEGRWYLHLFKRHFHAVVSDGHISQVRLWCDRRYVFFAFDPTLRYEVSSKDGNCSIELDGAPGTRFKLLQF